MRDAIIAICLLFVCTISSASAEEEYPFPQLQTEVFCKDSVARMLDANEQAAELKKCLIQEMFLREKLEPWWPFLGHKTQRMIVKAHYRLPEHHTYITLLSYTSSAIGEACLAGRIKCQNPKAP